MTCLIKQFLFFIYFGTFLVKNVQCGTQELNSVRGPLHEFSSHDVVIPKIRHSRTKRELTSNVDSIHRDHVEIKIDLDGEENILELYLNTKLIGGDFQLSYDDGKKVVYKKTKYSDINFCQYTGVVKDKPNSWVALSICDGISGVINNGKQIKYIEPRHIKDEHFQHYVYDHRNLVMAHKCGVDSITIQNKTSETTYININEDNTSKNIYNNVIEDNALKNTSNNIFENNASANAYPRTRKTRIKRHVDGNPRPIYNNESFKSRYVELLVVIDKSLRKYGMYRNIIDYTQDIVNIVNSMYASLDIQLVLTQVHVIRSDDNNMVVTNFGNVTLNNFVVYANNELDTRFDIALFLTIQKFAENVVGLANVRAICSDLSMGIATLHSDSKGIVAATVAHEIGHLFGMNHDIDSCTCPEDKCIMDASSTSFIPSEWSSCSLKNLMLTLDRGSDFCLRNKPSVLYKSPSCGNGILEYGEQCDCGTDMGRPVHRDCSVCCQVDECLLRENATCANGACCDLKTCQPHEAGRVCRAARGECDLPERCAGSQHCPADLHVMDSAPCAGGEAFCIDGSCQSHSQRCYALFGMGSVKASDEFYHAFNIKGDMDGYCEKTMTLPKRYLGDKTVTYTPCSKSDVMCGKILCTSFSFLRYQTFGHSKIFLLPKGDHVIHCTSSNVNTCNNYENPLLVPNGAKCGVNKMCFNQKCISVDVIRTKIANLKDSVCPSNCSGNGICNSKGHCHCNEGFGPPLCDVPGNGGSIDSEFVYKETEVLHKLEVVLYVIFFAIVPIAIGIIVIYFYRKYIMFWYTINVKYRTNKSPKSRTVVDNNPSNTPKSTQAQQTAANNIEPTTISVVNNSSHDNLEDLNIVDKVTCQHSPATTSGKNILHITTTCDNKKNYVERSLARKEKLSNPTAHGEVNKNVLKTTNQGDTKIVKNTSRRSSKNRVESDPEHSDSVKNLIKKFNKP